MWQMTPDARMGRNPAPSDLWAPEKQLALFIEAFLLDLAPGSGEWLDQVPMCTVARVIH